MANSKHAKHFFRRLFWLLGALIIILILLYAFGNKASAPSHPYKPNSQSTVQKQPPATAKPDHSLSNPASIWVVVNKRRPLDPKDYKPKLVVPDVNLRWNSSAENMHVSATMAPHLKELFTAAKQAGYPMMLSSGFRSYSYQIQIYGQQVKQYGKKYADQESARPGYSEHQTGLAADVAPASGKCDLSQCFGSTPTGQWLDHNAWRYGFVIRYPKGKQNITGYMWEPWHIRYIGKYASAQMHEKSILTLEQYFGTGAAPTYK